MFKNRKEAGLLLAKKLSAYKKKKDILILSIPRGGVEVGYQVAEQLSLPLDVVIIKKIGVPGNEELALGAAGLDSYYINEEFEGRIPPEYIQELVKIKQQEVRERRKTLRGRKPMYKVKGKTVIIVDDGIATGATMMMAVKMIKKQSPKKIIVAIPVAPPRSVNKLKEVANEVVCLLQPEFLMAIGMVYQDFRQVEDEEVKKILEEANK